MSGRTRSSWTFCELNLLALVGLLLAAHSARADFPKSLVTTVPYLGQGSIDVDGRWLVWYDARNGVANMDIYAHDLSSGVEFPVCTEPGRQTAPVLSGDLVVWMDETKRDIFAYDLARQVAVPIGLAGGTRQFPQISGNTLMWSTSSWHRARAIDLLSGAEVPLPTESIPGSWLSAINGHTAFGWRPIDPTTVESNVEAFASDLGTGEYIPLWRAGAPGWSFTLTYDLAIDGDTVAWGEYGSLRIFDLRQRTQRHLDLAPLWATAKETFDLDGDLLAFVDGSDSTRLWGYDLANDNQFLISSSGGAKRYPRINGNQVIWVEDGAKIFAATIVPEPSTFVLLGTAAVGLLAYAWRRRQTR